MASKKDSLGQYVISRKKKYSNKYSRLLHISLSPRKILHPNITSYAYWTICRDKKSRITNQTYRVNSWPDLDNLSKIRMLAHLNAAKLTMGTIRCSLQCRLSHGMCYQAGSYVMAQPT